MINKLRSNYSLTLWLTRLFFCISYVFGDWLNIKTVCSSYSSLIVEPFFGTFWFCVIVGFISAVIWLVLISVLCRLAIRFLNLYSFPQHEFLLILVFFFGLYYFVLGALYLFALITPVVYVWGSILFPVVAIILSAMLFYLTISKLYLNNSTAPRFFKIVLIFTCIVGGVNAVTGLLGGFLV